MIFWFFFFEMILIRISEGNAVRNVKRLELLQDKRIEYQLFAQQSSVVEREGKGKMEESNSIACVKQFDPHQRKNSDGLGNFLSGSIDSDKNGALMIVY